ncbi:MAG: CPBP family intramembrane metalloprotease [Cyclobacteriaceae bacterium]|nr:CPBP family intramembrane metalloprotease [Cyclobacteriaceae bacterium]
MRLPYTFSEIKKIEFKPAFILCLSATCLLSINFFSGYSKFTWFKDLFGFFGFETEYKSIDFKLNESQYKQFWQLLYWSNHTFLFYFIIPCLAIRFVLKEKLISYGLKIKGAFLFVKLYGIALVAILPIVVYVSFSSHFQVTYPFFVPLEDDLFPYFFVWELFYVLQFFALEFFFRGFMVQGLRSQLGIYSVFVMMVPYCMIHFAKPLPECIGSIFAGIFLGLMSYRTNSIWLGAFLHAAVALSMDFLSLWHKGYF